MNTVVYPLTACLPDAEPAGIAVDPNTGANPVHLDALIHELRQPLGVIESLTFFMELTTTDDKIRPRLEQIQSMLTKVHQMLEDANERGVSQWPSRLRHESR